MLYYLCTTAVAIVTGLVGMDIKKANASLNHSCKDFHAVRTGIAN